MISIGSDYSIYLYSARVDMRKGIDGLCAIVKNELGYNTKKPKCLYIFSGRNPRVKKVLIREYNRYELVIMRLDEGKFIAPVTDENRLGGKISWTDYVTLTETTAKVSVAVKYID